VSTAQSTPQTLAQKIIARAAGRESVRVGELVIGKVDLAMMHDSGGPRRVAAMLKEIGATVWNRDKVVVVSDHFVPAVDAESAKILKLTRDWVRANQVDRFHDMQGICHVVITEHGYVSPGMFCVGGDSHSPTAGAFGAFMFGVGATEMAGVLATGEIWIKVPETQLIQWRGALGQGLSAKDMILATLKRLKLNTLRYGVAQYAGSAVTALSMSERMVLSNMAAELGAQTGLIAPDATTFAHLAAAGVDIKDASVLVADTNAVYAATHDFDASSLVPQVAAPHSPDNVADIDQTGRVRIDQAYIGACTGAKLSDLRMAAEVLKGHRVAAGVRLLVAPASTRMTAEAAADGTLATLTAAGAILLPSGCGACAGYGAGILAEDEVCISSTARNFRGRMGAASASVYLASPYTVAASAIAGCITDPRPLLAERRAA
jgi:3-isopropylmalate/(R)-2-methylmalate dehydratase large subunit